MPLEHKASRCMWIADDGTPWQGFGGCRKSAENCTYAHPEDPQWATARPPRQRPDPHRPPERGDDPGRGRGKEREGGFGRGGGFSRDRDSGYGGRRPGANGRDSSRGKTSYSGSGGWNGGGWDASGHTSTKNDASASNGWGSTDWAQAADTSDSSRPHDEPTKSNWGDPEPEVDDSWASGGKDGWGDTGNTWGSTADESLKRGEGPSERSAGRDPEPTTERSSLSHQDPISSRGYNVSRTPTKSEASPRKVSAPHSAASWSHVESFNTAREQPWDEVMADIASDAGSSARQQQRPEPSESGSRRGREPDVRDYLEPDTPTCEPYVLDDDEKFIPILMLNSMDIMDEISVAEEEVKKMILLKTTEVFRKLNRAGRKQFCALFSDTKMCLAISRSKQTAYMDALGRIESDPTGSVYHFQDDKEEQLQDEMLSKYALDLRDWVDAAGSHAEDMMAYMVEQETNANHLSEAHGDPAQDLAYVHDLEGEVSNLTLLLQRQQNRLDALDQAIKGNCIAHELATFVDNRLVAIRSQGGPEETEQVTNTDFAYAEAELHRLTARIAQVDISRAQVEEDTGVSHALSYLDDDLTRLADDIQEADTAWLHFQQQAVTLQEKIARTQDHQHAQTDVVFKFEQARSNATFDAANQAIQSDVLPELERVLAAVRTRVEAQVSQFRLERALDQARDWIDDRYVALAGTGF